MNTSGYLQCEEKHKNANTVENFVVKKPKLHIIRYPKRIKFTDTEKKNIAKIKQNGYVPIEEEKDNRKHAGFAYIYYNSNSKLPQFVILFMIFI